MQGSYSDWMRFPGRADDRPRLALFRGQLSLDGKPDSSPIQITADSRYKLYVNGVLVETGPVCGNEKTWYVDAVDIAPWLQTGENILAVEVLRYPPIHGKGHHGVVRTESPGLYVRTVLSVKWKCCLNEGFEIVPEDPWFSPPHDL